MGGEKARESRKGQVGKGKQTRGGRQVEWEGETEGVYLGLTHLWVTREAVDQWYHRGPQNVSLAT